VYVEYCQNFYSATIVNTRRDSSGLNYFVHYQGFKKSSDTWVKESLIHEVNTAMKKLFEAQRKSNNDGDKPARVAGCADANRAIAMASGASGNKPGCIAKVTSSDNKKSESSVNQGTKDNHGSEYVEERWDGKDEFKFGRARWKRRLCSFGMCTNQSQKGGHCIRHGACLLRCSHEGCTNNRVQNGRCARHGGKVKKCSHNGCTNNVKVSGLCLRHGAPMQKCIHEGCTNYRQKGLTCKRHYAPPKCIHEGCTFDGKKGLSCIRHAAK
jgi:hypothetical protein